MTTRQFFPPWRAHKMPRGGPLQASVREMLDEAAAALGAGNLARAEALYIFWLTTRITTSP
jgi:hypothetical protein